MTTATTNETTFALDIDGTEEEVFDRHAPELTRIYWKNGADKAKRQPGSFYVAANDLTATPAAPWAPSERYDEAGYETSQITATVIGYRAQWFRLVSSIGGERKEWLKTYEEGARKLVEILAFVSGIDEPVVISAKGMVGKALEDVLHRHERRILKAAEQLTGARSLNRWAVAIPIASALDERGKVQYMEFKQGGSITPPAVAWPADASVEDIVRLFWQDKATRARCAELRREYDGWLKERRGEDAAAAAPAAYVPQPMETLPDLRPEAQREQPPDVLEWDKPADMTSAEYRFWQRYSHVVGGGDWKAVQAFLKSRAPKPTSPEGWIAAAEAVQRVPASVAVEADESLPF